MSNTGNMVGMATKMMNPIDAGFLLGESDTNLMHVAGLTVFRLPEGAGPDYVHKQVDKARQEKNVVAPFNRRPEPGILGKLLPRWEIVKEIDLDYHLQHHALPWPGDQRELGILVSRLHGIRMDRSRPLWETHVIEGLEGDRVAYYTKLHHALVDGVAATRLARKTMTEDPNETDMPQFWAFRDTKRKKADPEEAELDGAADWTSMLTEAFLGPVRGVTAQVASAQALARMYAGLDITRLRRTAGELARPYQAPKSILNGAITAHRRIATQSYELDRLQQIARSGGGSLNDVVLAVCSGGLRRYLDELGELPDRSLIAGMPMSFRPKDSDQSEGNATTMALAKLATDVDDVKGRFDAIVASTTEAKEHMSRLPRAAIMSYSMLLMAPMGLGLATGTATPTPPMYNVVISNVPGPRKQLYRHGLKLEEWYPVSIPTHKQALNITVLSYAGTMNFSFTACGTTLPRLQHLALHCREALGELETAFA